MHVALPGYPNSRLCQSPRSAARGPASPYWPGAGSVTLRGVAGAPIIVAGVARAVFPGVVPVDIDVTQTPTMTDLVVTPATGQVRLVVAHRNPGVVEGAPGCRRRTTRQRTALDSLHETVAQ